MARRFSCRMPCLRARLAVMLAALSVGAVLTGVVSSYGGADGVRAGDVGGPALGYWLLAPGGEVIPFGAAEGGGQLRGLHKGEHAVAIVADPSAQGYWVTTQDGRVFAVGGARYYGGLVGRGAEPAQTAAIVGMASSAGGAGYWLVDAKGEVFSFGKAHFFGPRKALHLRSPIVAIVARPGGGGYWLATAGGEVLGFGGAHVYGRAEHAQGGGEVVGMAAAPDGRGYWLARAYGGVLAFGDARDFGATPAVARVVGIAAVPSGEGYWLAEVNGSVVGFGAAAGTARSGQVAHLARVDGISASYRLGYSAGKAVGRSRTELTTTTAPSVTPTGAGTTAAGATTTLPAAIAGGALFGGGTPAAGDGSSVTVSTSGPVTSSLTSSSTTASPTTTAVLSSTTSTPSATTTTTSQAGTGYAQVCDNPTYLQSPYTYDGTATSFTSGQYGLPTYGSPGSDFPNATAGVVVPAGDNSGLVTQPATVYYFEPGLHTNGGNGWYSQAGMAFVGGYSPSLGEAVIDGGGATGARGQFLNNPDPATGANVTIEYLTIQNWASSQQSALMNTSQSPGWVVEHDTIGPNLVSHWGNNGVYAGQNSLGGYAMNVGYGTTIEYDCFTYNSQGALNAGGGDPGLGGGHWCMPDKTGPDCWLLSGVTISYNEFSHNGLGDYPDPCGCVANLGKISYSLNVEVTHNYVHDGYGVGIWFDFNNAGADISDNYIASNWNQAIIYEASYNANISGNTIVGNGWASDGAWPTCPGYNPNNLGIGCAEGGGPVDLGLGNVPYSAIYVSDSGGNSLVPSNYSGELLVDGNTLTDNYGGIIVYSNSVRRTTEVDNDGGQCNEPLLGLASSTYYANYDQEKDYNATISGTSLTTSDSGFSTGQCGDPLQGVAANTTENPFTLCSSCTWYAFWDGMTGGPYQVSSCSSATSCTLAGTPSGTLPAGTTVYLSTPGGCSLYDFYGATSPGNSGSPAADYWDNCIWASRNVQVSGNSLSLDSNLVYCPQDGNASYALDGNLGCGVNGLFSGGGGINLLWDIYNPFMPNNIAKASGGMGNVWTANTYSFTGNGGYGGWVFIAGSQGSVDPSTTAASTQTAWEMVWGQD